MNVKKSAVYFLDTLEVSEFWQKQVCMLSVSGIKGKQMIRGCIKMQFLWIFSFI